MSGGAVDDKPQNDPEHFEGDLKRDNGVILKSDHDKLGVWATVWRFKKVCPYPHLGFGPQTDLLTSLQAVLVCNLLCIAASADGYQINLNGLCTISCTFLTGTDVHLREHNCKLRVYP